MKPPRVLSLLPSCTEIVCALGLEELLVGRSHECDFPESIRALPACTRSSIDSDRSSAGIDQQVKSGFRDALSLYQVDIALVRELNPDVILTQAQCEVCALSLADVQKALAGQEGVDARLVSVSPKRLTDLWENIRVIADACGVKDRGKSLIKGLKSRMVDMIEKTCMQTRKPSVVCIEWLNPLMSAGNWVPDLVELVGGEPLLAKAGEHSPWMKWEDVVAADPHFIFVMPCGFAIDRTLSEISLLTRLPGWDKLRAVKKKNVIVVDANQFFNRPGPRLIDSMEIIVEVFHPTKFKFGHAGKAWRKLDA